MEHGKLRRRRQRQPRDVPMRRQSRPDEAEAAVHGAYETLADADADADGTPHGTPNEGDARAAAVTGRTPPDDRRPPFPAFCSRCSRGSSAAPQRVSSLPARPGSGNIVLSDTPCPTMRTTLDPRLHSPSILNRLFRSSISIMTLPLLVFPINKLII